MNQVTGYMVLILIGFLAVFGTACGKKTGAGPAVVNATPKLPGEGEVMAALEKKDYDGAMAALLKVKQTVATDEQQVQFMILSRQAKDKLLEAAATDQKAAEALAALRTLTSGR